MMEEDKLVKLIVFKMRDKTLTAITQNIVSEVVESIDISDLPGRKYPGPQAPMSKFDSLKKVYEKLIQQMVLKYFRDRLHPDEKFQTSNLLRVRQPYIKMAHLNRISKL